MLELGTSKKIITPKSPVFLAGYADRKEPYSAIYEDIRLRILAFKDNDIEAIVVNADLIWWSENIIMLLQHRLKALNINPDNIIFTATHNHSGPGLGSTFLDCLERVDEDYREDLIKLTIEAIVEARNDYDNVSLYTSEGLLDINVYRRLMVNGRIEMKPNYSITPDNKLTLIRANRENGKPKGIILHYPCHANLSKENAIQPDWAGSALNMIDNELDGCTSIFLQGCTGDLRPNSVLGNSFVPCDRVKVMQFATIFKDKAMELYHDANPAKNMLTPISIENTRLPIDSSNIPECKDPKLSMLWKEKIEEKGRRQSEVLKTISFGLSEYSLLFFNAEVVQSYAAYARMIKEKTICSGYTNGMIGYLPNEKQIEEGGYESKDSAIYFALAGTFDKAIENIIKKQIKGALK